MVEMIKIAKKNKERSTCVQAELILKQSYDNQQSEAAFSKGRAPFLFG